MNRESTGIARTLGVYFTIAFAALQALDVMLDRLGLPDRWFTQASITVVLLLPAAVAVGLIRRLLLEEDAGAAGLQRRGSRGFAEWEAWEAGARRAGQGSEERARGSMGGGEAAASTRCGVEAGSPVSGRGAVGATARAGAPGAELAAAHLRMAKLYEARGDGDRALEHYERYVELSEVLRERDPPASG